MAQITKETCHPLHIQQNSQQAEDWKAANPILLKGEMGMEVDTGRFKVGDGIRKWNQLPYAADPVGSAPAVDAKLTAHMADTVKHTTQAEKDKWNSKAEGNHDHDGRYDPVGAAAVVEDRLESHQADSTAHTTQAEKDVWNSKAEGNHDHDSRYDPMGAAETAAANKMDKVPEATNGNIAVFDGAGNVRDYGTAPVSLDGINQELADLSVRLENKVDVEKPKWVDILLINGTTVSQTNSPLQCCRIGNIVYLQGSVVLSQTTPYDFATLPENCRGGGFVVTSTSHADGKAPCCICVRGSNLHCYGTLPDTALESGTVHYIQTSYIVMD